jgi:hypothetical protein
VPQRRQKRALADSDRPHWPQLCTPMALIAPATSRADASQNALGDCARLWTGLAAAPLER